MFGLQPSQSQREVLKFGPIIFHGRVDMPLYRLKDLLATNIQCENPELNGQIYLKNQKRAGPVEKGHGVRSDH